MAGGAAGREAGGAAGDPAGGTLGRAPGGGAIGLVAKLEFIVVTAEATGAVVEAIVAAGMAAGIAAALADPAGAGGIMSVTSSEAIARGGGGGGIRETAGLGKCWALGKCCVSVIDPVIGERWAVSGWGALLRRSRKGRVAVPYPGFPQR